MTVSGVVVAFRKKALVDVGLWDHDMITEDISISWKLQERFWDIRYEPRALCWMLVLKPLEFGNKGFAGLKEDKSHITSLENNT